MRNLNTWPRWDLGLPYTVKKYRDITLITSPNEKGCIFQYYEAHYFYFADGKHSHLEL